MGFIKSMAASFLVKRVSKHARNLAYKILEELIEELIAKHEHKIKVDFDEKELAPILVKVLRDKSVTDDEKRKLIKAGIDVIVANDSLVSVIN